MFNTENLYVVFDLRGYSFEKRYARAVFSCFCGNFANAIVKKSLTLSKSNFDIAKYIFDIAQI